MQPHGHHGHEFDRRREQQLSGVLCAALPYLLEEIPQTIADLPRSGYQRVWSILRCEERQSDAPVNAKSVYRVMQVHGLLVQRRTKPTRLDSRSAGKGAVPNSNQRWCSDGFEFRCEKGEPLRATLPWDCCALKL